MKTLRVSLIVMCVVTAAFAASVHFVRGPVFTDLGTTLYASGKLAGLGNGDITVGMTAQGVPTAVCTNQGGNSAPGQNPATVTLSGVQVIPSDQIKNGTVSIAVTTNPPPQPTAQEAGCPNSNWSATITDVRFTSATITITQGGQIVFRQTYVL